MPPHVQLYTPHRASFELHVHPHPTPHQPTGTPGWATPPPQELHLIVDPHHAHFGGSENTRGVT